jgi:D-alanine-D-alanine ligase
MDGRGNVSFMEANPLAGLHPKHSDLPIICAMVGISFQELIHRILSSARARAGI